MGVVNLLPARLVEILFGLLLIWIAQRLIRRAQQVSRAEKPAE